jgi:hypothetical protein
MTGYVLLGMVLVWVIRAVIRSRRMKREVKGQTITRSRGDSTLVLNPKTRRWS